MRILALVSVVMLMGVGAVVGGRLLALARRTREIPELAVGAGLFSYTVICQPLILLGGALGPSIPDGARLALSLGVSLSSAVTIAGLYLFSWRVFRAEARWARALTFAGIAVALAMAAVNALLREGATNPTTALVSVVNYAVAFSWGGFESLRYYALLRRRAAIGLGDPVVRNRFLLWGASMATGALIDVLLVSCLLAGRNLGTDPIAIALCMIAAAVNAICWYLAFLPPAAYLRWLRSSVGAAVPAV